MAQPTVDDLLGPPPAPGGLPSVDSLLGPQAPPPMMAGEGASTFQAASPEMDHYIANSSVGKVLDAFGQGLKNGWGAGNLGLSDESTEALKKAGVFPDVQKGQGGLLRAFNEAVMRPAAAGVDALMRAGSAVVGGLQGAVAQTGAEVGLPGLGRDIAALPEVFQQEAGSAPGVLARGPRVPDLAAARDLGVIGQPEGVWTGVAEPVAPPPSIVNDNVREAQTAAPEPEAFAPAAEASSPPAGDMTGLRAEADTAIEREHYSFMSGPDFYNDEADPRHAYTAAMSSVPPDVRGRYLVHGIDATRGGSRTDALMGILRDRPSSMTAGPVLPTQEEAATGVASTRTQAPYLLVFEDGKPMGDGPSMVIVNSPSTAVVDKVRAAFPGEPIVSPQEAAQAMRDNTVSRSPPAAAPAPAPTTAGNDNAGAAPAPSDVHELARQIAPATFDEFDALRQHSDELRARIVEETDALRRQAEAQAPHAAEVADLENRLQDTTPRLAKKYQARLDAIRPDHDAFLSDEFTMGALTRETPEIAALRQQLLETDFRMRDLAPDVSEAYRQAAERMPAQDIPAAGARPDQPVSPPAEAGLPVSSGAAAPAVEPPPVAEPFPEPEPIPAVEPRPAAEPAVTTPEPGRAVEPPKVVPVSNIAGDVSRKLQAAGRPVEEADAAGQVTEAMWRTRADAFEGRKGSAQEMYAREAPDIRAGREATRARQPEYAQTGAQGKIRLTEDGRSVMTLFRTANASTFLHESGHDWLERMMRDAADPDATARMRDDAATVRGYLGVNEGDAIPTKAHEKFARSFERYFMEGRAPSPALAGVFAKFRDWLTTIYQTVAKLRAPITPDIRDVFDRLLSSNPEREPAIVPERAADAPPAPKPVKPSRAPAYVPTPREPKRLVQYLRDIGGVRDFGGDLADMLGRGNSGKGLIDNIAGQEPDHAALLAWEDGYFPEHSERPSINDLLNAIDDDMRGNARYSDKDRDKIEAYNNAVAHNSEVDRLSAVYGVDPAGLTREQFFDKLAEEMSREQQGEEAQSQAEAHEAEFADAAAEYREWAEERYGEWNSDESYGLDGPRTQQELEDAYRSSDVAGPTRQSDASDGQPGPAAGPAEQVQAGGGSRDSGAGDAGRDGAAGSAGGTAAGNPPTSPNEPFGRTDTDLIDRAGNIRLDNLNQPESVNAVIREAAEASDDFTNARRGVISDGQVLDLADALGMKAVDLDRRKLGQAFNAEQVMAARKLLVQSATAVRDAMVKAAAGSDADVLAYGEARARHLMIQEQVAGITAEAGRALRAFRSIGEEGSQVQAIGDFLQGATGKTLFQMQREAQMGAALQTPQQVAKFLNDSKKPSFGDMALEYWINGLISGPATHTTYAVGNALLALWKAVPETGVAAAIGGIRRLAGDTGPRVYGGEVGAGLYGILKGQRDGIMAAGKAVRTGLTTELPGENTGAAQASFLAMQPQPGGAIPGLVGEVVRLPSRGVATIHSYFRAIGYSEAMAQLAYRQAASEGLAGSAFAARVADLSVNPPAAMMRDARAAATDQTMMNSGGAFTQKVADLTNTPIMGVRLLKIVDPFVKIGSNVMTQALLERSPLGVLDPDIRANLMGRNGAVARDTQIARIAVGSALGAATIGLAAQGFITGGGPADPKEANIWRMTGRQPYSVRIGDTWYGIHRLGPLAMIMGVGADMYEFGESMETHDASKLGGLLVGSITKGLLNESFMRGPADLIQALEDPDRYGARYVRDQLGTLLPYSTAEEQVARAVDPYAREARTTMDSLKARIPWLSQTLLRRNDIWGQPIPNKSDFGGAGVTAIMESRVNNDPVNQALMRLNVFPAMPEHSIVGVPLTDAQYDNFSRTAGRMAHMRLESMVGTPGFSTLPPGVQTKAITDIISSSRRAAEELTKMQNPEIIQQAVQAKRDLLTNGRPAR